MRTSVPTGSHSYHHQSIDRVVTNLQIVALSSDGVIEAEEHRIAKWIIEVQWHPEDDATTDEQQQGLFNALIVSATILRILLAAGELCKIVDGVKQQVG